MGDNFSDFNSSIILSSENGTSRTLSLPNVKPESIKIHVDKKSKTVTVTANESNQSSNNGCEYSSSSSCSYKFQLPERVIFDSLKSELEGAILSMKWEVDEEEDKNEENNKNKLFQLKLLKSEI